MQDLYAGADPAYRLNVRVVTELAWHGLFIRHLLRRPDRAELAGFVPGFTILNCPSFRADPARHGCRSETVIAISFEQKLILIGGTAYAGENKKSVFTVLNYLLPERGVMPMHCSANHAEGDPGDVAIFFGLSGTGKTTLSADPGPGADRRRRARLVRPRHLQLRGRLLRQDHQPLRRGRARDLRHHQPLRHRGREHGLGPGHPRPRLRRRQPDRQHPLRLSARGDLERQPHLARRHAAERRDADLRRLRGAAADRAADARRRRCTTSSPASPPRSPAPSAASPSRSRPSPPASARRSCRAGRRSTARSCATASPGPAPPAGWSTPAGPAAPTAPAAACRSRRPGRS